MSKILPADVQHDVVHHIPALRRFACRFCRNSSEIDDLVQETLVKAIAASDTFEPGTRLKSWLFTIMRNVYCTSYNKQRRVVLGLDRTDDWILPSPATQEWTVRGKELQGAIACLSDDHREVVDLVLVQGWTYDEVASLKSCAVGTIKSRISRARERLAIAMGDTIEDALYV